MVTRSGQAHAFRSFSEHPCSAAETGQRTRRCPGCCRRAACSRHRRTISPVAGIVRDDPAHLVGHGGRSSRRRECSAGGAAPLGATGGHRARTRNSRQASAPAPRGRLDGDLAGPLVSASAWSNTSRNTDRSIPAAASSVRNVCHSRCGRTRCAPERAPCVRSDGSASLIACSVVGPCNATNHSVTLASTLPQRHQADTDLCTIPDVRLLG